jgi:hypothetical protein
MKNLSLILENTGSSQVSFFAINALNKIREKETSIDSIIFCEEIHKNCIPANFSVMPISEAWLHHGPIIATTLSTAKKLINFASDEKFFYVWDLEWIRNKPIKKYEDYIDVYTNKSLKLIARSESHKNIIESTFNRNVSNIVSDFNVSELMEAVK